MDKAKKIEAEVAVENTIETQEKVHGMHEAATDAIEDATTQKQWEAAAALQDKLSKLLGDIEGHLGKTMKEFSGEKKMHKALILKSKQFKRRADKIEAGFDKLKTN